MMKNAPNLLEAEKERARIINQILYAWPLYSYNQPLTIHHEPFTVNYEPWTMNPEPLTINH